MKPADRPLEFLSLFAGAGGLDLGLEQAGWTCRYAVDSDADAVATLRANQGPDFAADALLECADVRELTGRQLLKRLGRKKGEIPLMAGGPPCQSWSSAGQQKGLVSRICVDKGARGAFQGYDTERVAAHRRSGAQSYAQARPSL